MGGFHLRFQVLSAFLGTAYLTLICCIAKVVIDHKRPRHDSNSLLCRWSFALRNVIVALSDQQVVTGISIIIEDCAGFTKAIKYVVYKLVRSLYVLIISGNDMCGSRAWEVHHLPVRYEKF